VGIALALVAGAAGSEAGAQPAREAAAGQVGYATLRHAPTGFSVQAPRGFGLSFRRGVYVLRDAQLTMSFSRSVTSVAPAQFGAALLQQLGGTVVSRGGTVRQFSAQIDRSGRREAFVVARVGAQLAVTTGSSPSARPLPLAVVARVGASARGGVALRAPGGQSSSTAMPLKEYRAPDGGATALVPSEPGWQIASSRGVVEGSHPKRGSFVFGSSISVIVPGVAPGPVPPNIVVHPFVFSADALVQVIPRFAPAISGVRIRRVLLERVLPTFSSSAVFLYDYRVNGRPWTGVALIATDTPQNYSNLSWLLYTTAIGVPRGTDPTVGVGLLRSWRSWNPSGAIAARNQRIQQLLNDTNEVWRQTNEFRARTADRQSRDVGCLLQGYYFIEDNSRKYDLPALPCGQVYVRGNP